MDQQHYHIRVAGHGGPLWSEWFAGLTVTNLENGEAILSGPLPDQAALHGVLTRLRDFGLPLLSVERDTDDPQSRSQVTETLSRQEDTSREKRAPGVTTTAPE